MIDVSPLTALRWLSFVLGLCMAATSLAQEPAAADVQAIHKASVEFTHAFAKGDAKAVAAFWTEQGEFHEPAGALLVGRAAIEKAFAAFFKEHPAATLDVLIRSIRFPAADVAIEEGVLRLNASSKDLPTTTLYSVTHVRQSGAWRIAVSREWGAGQDRLEDLDWLLGRWQADSDTTMTFRRDANKPYVMVDVTKKADGKLASAGSIRIGFEPRRGQLRSWHFDEEGGHGEALWRRDGTRWLIDASGVLPDGRETSAVYVLSRIGPDEFTWRSIERFLGTERVPDTVPIKLRRVPR